MLKHLFVYLLHLLFVAPLLIYAGYIGRDLSDKASDENSKMVFSFLIAVGVTVGLYHGFKLATG